MAKKIDTLSYTTNDVINCIEIAASRRLGFSVKLIVGQWQNVPSWATWHEKYDGGRVVGVLLKEQEIDMHT